MAIFGYFAVVYEYDPVTWAVVSQAQGSLVKISNNVVVDSYTFILEKAQKPSHR